MLSWNTGRKADPWELEHESKPPLLCLVDILCDLPGILQDASSLQRQNIGTKQYVPLYEILQDDVMNHLLALYEWRVNWEEEDPNSLSWDWISRQRKLFVFYHPSFTRLNQANKITFYNAIFLILLNIGQEVIEQPYHSLIHTRPRNYPNCPIPAHSSPSQHPIPKAIAIEICHSVDCNLPHWQYTTSWQSYKSAATPQYQRQIMARSHASTSQLRQKNSFSDD